MEQLIIIGGGPAGLTAALYAARAGYSPLVLTGDMPGGMLTQIDKIDNYPGFPGGVNGFELADAMQRQAENAGARMDYANAAAVRFASDEQMPVHEIECSDGRVLETQAVIIATGTRHKHLGLPGEAELLGRGISYCAVCDGAFWKGRVVAVVGNNRITLEETAYLSGIAGKVHLINPEPAFKADAVLAERVLGLPNVICHPETRITQLEGATQKKLSGLVLENAGQKDHLTCEALFVAIGLQPGTDIFRGQIEMDGAAVRRPSPPSTRTSCRGVFAAGDCADKQYRQVVIAASEGAKAAMDVTGYLKNLQEKHLT